ncbi:MAG: hypothetical protein Q8K31_03555 [Burkholderiaceae bacterium]|nr:hypothetical protein [Burkholderiaceae bacterium]
MAITSAERANIIKVVVALYNAAPGATYLSDLTVAYEANGRSLVNLARDLSATTSYKALNPVFQTAAEFATAFLTPFGLQANTEAVDFVTSRFNAGVNKGEIAYLAAEAINAYTGTTQAIVDAKAILTNKTTVAEYYSVTKAIAQTSVASLQQAISTVTAVAGSVTTAQTAIDNGSAGVSGTSFVMATTADNLTGTSANDTFNGVAGTGATFSAADLINGGSGTDTLSIVTDNNFTLVGSNLTSIEKIQVNATAAANVTFSNVSGVTDLVNNGSSAALQFGVDDAAAGNDVNTIANLSINGATAATLVTYSDTALAGTADAMTLNLSTYGTSTSIQAVTILTETAAANELETLSINATGTNAITLTTDGTQTSLKTLNIAGAGSLTLRLAADNIRTSATTINASTATGAVAIGTDGAGQVLGAANHTVTLGTGNDSVYFGANLNASDTVDGGAGTDTLGVSAALTNSIMTNVKNFETVRFDVAGNVTQDAGITSLAGLNYAVVGAGTLAISNLANATTITVAAATTTLTASLKDSSGLADTVNVTGTGTTAGYTLTTLTNIAGLETLNLATGTTSTSNFTITTDAVTAKHVVTGAANLTITNAIATNQFDASAFTGKLNVKGQAAAATNIQGGTAADTILLGTAADTVNGGAGNDAITLGTAAANNTSGADVIVTGAGNDTVTFVGNTAAGTGGSTDYTAFAAITDFTVGTSTSASDFLAFSGNDADFSLKTASGATTTTTGLAKGATAQGLTAADAMVVQTIAKDATAAALTANVSFFKLTTNVAFTTDIKGTFVAALGTSTITGLGANGNYVVSVFDSTNNKAIIGVVNVGGNADADTVLAANDFVNADVAVVGVVNMTSADYANFGAVNLAVAA